MRFIILTLSLEHLSTMPSTSSATLINVVLQVVLLTSHSPIRLNFDLHREHHVLYSYTDSHILIIAHITPRQFVRLNVL